MPYGLVEPTPWERRFVAWCSRRLGRAPEPGWDAPPPSNPGFAALASAVADPLAPAPPCDGVRLVAGDDLELEALGAVREVRRWLEPQPVEAWPAALDDVLVLLPTAGPRRALWRRTFERHGLAAEAPESLTIAETPVGRWLVALARLAGWEGARRARRDDLRNALLAPLLSMPEGARRSDLRACVRGLRSHSATVTEWEAHVAAFFDRQRAELSRDGDRTAAERRERGAEIDRREEGLVALTRSMADRLRDEASPFDGLLRLLDDLKVVARVRASGVDLSARALDRGARVLATLAREPGDGTPPAARLEEALAATTVRADLVPVHGARITTYRQFDGRPARLVVLAGLEEGGWPAAPSRRSRDEARIALALDLLSPAEELSRQARVAEAAVACARERVVLSWSRADEAGSTTFAGPLLAAVRGPDTARRVPEIRVGDAEAVPRATTDLGSPAEVLQSTRPAVGAALTGAFRERWAANARAAEHVGRIDAARAPERAAPVGPYTGLVGVPLVRERYSPTALEALGQCATRYLLERILGIEEQADAGVDLDAAELGSLLHEALAACAQQAIRARGAWELSTSDGGAAREKHVERIFAKLDGAMNEAIARHAASEPTLSPALVACVAERWKRTLRRWIEREADAPRGGVFAPGAPPRPADVTDEQLALLTKGGRDAVEKARRSMHAEALALLERARETAAASKAQADQWHAEAFSNRVSSLLTKKDFAAAACIPDGRARRNALATLQGAVETRQSAWDEAAVAHLAKAYQADRMIVPRRVVASEWSFGDEVPAGADPKSTKEPLVLGLPGGARIAIRGRVDRIDAAADRPDLAIVDYKTGRNKSDGVLRSEIGEGRHLQLPIYAAAAGRLLDGDAVPERCAVVAGRLEYPRMLADATVGVDDEVAPTFVSSDGTEHTLDEVLAAHLAHALRRLAAGMLPMLPRACPNDADHEGFCDYGDTCDFRPEARDRIGDPDPQPLFVNPPKPAPDRKEKPLTLPAYPDAAPVPDPPSCADGAAVHGAGRALARDLARDVVLEAGAGSGKTTALVDRYVGALESGCVPDEVLCITFTRKSTAEMRARVRGRLLSAAGEPGRLRGWIAGLSCAPIHTIDAFAAVVVKELGGEPCEAAERIGDVAAEYVADRLAREAGRPRRALEVLLEKWPLPQLRAALEALIVRERGLDEAAALGAGGVLAAWNDEAARLAPAVRDEVERFAKRAARLAAAADEDSLRIVGPLADGLGTALEAFERRGAIAGLWATRSVPLNGQYRKAADDVLALRAELGAWRFGRIAWFEKAFEALAECATAAEVSKRLRLEARLSAAALEVAAGWRDGFRELRRTRRLETFGEVLDRATALVAAAEPADLRARFPFRHLLVDEFQDTDGAQLHFIDTLVGRLRAGARDGGCRLFVVGDPKQSIYRFRGAEVDLFEERCANAGTALGKLTTCFRSEPALTRAIDRIFSRLLAGTAPDGETPLDAPARVPWAPLAPRSGDGGVALVELLVPDGGGPLGREDDGEQEQLPPDEGVEAPLVRRIRGLLAEAVQQECGDESPIAVLTHSWDRAIYYGQLLRAHGVPAFVQGGRGLLAVREVRDLLHWLAALERQDDDLSFAALLRGATVGISDPGLYCLRRGHGLELRDFATGGWSPAKPSPRLSRLRHGFRFDAARAIAAMSVEREGHLARDVVEALERDGERLELFDRTIAWAAERFGHLPPLDVLDGIVAATGYEAVLRARPDGLQALASLRAFRELLREAQSGAAPGEVVRELQRLTEAGDDPAAPGLNLSPGAAVLVTVVHQAKGREWDTVIVPDLHRKKLRMRVERCDPQRVVHPRRGKPDRRWIPTSFVESSKDLFATEKGAGGRVLEAATRGAERAESRRLLYVACTRARKRLVLGGRWPDAAKLSRWMDSLGGSLGLPVARSWMEDVVFALQFREGSSGRIGPSDVWREGRDFVWVSPAGAGFGEAEPEATSEPDLDPARVRAAARAIEVVPLRIVNPSSVEPDPASPSPAIARPVVPPAALGRSPFGCADEEGTAFHRAVQLWSYRGECTPDLVARAVRTTCGDARLGDRSARLAALVAMQRTTQPALVAELEAAAARGDVHHEVAVGYVREDGAWVEGSIDLLYRGADGAWHVVDYKTSQVPDEAKLRAKIAEHHGQVRAYAEALGGRVPGPVGSYALWFVSGGVVARWVAA